MSDILKETPERPKVRFGLSVRLLALAAVFIMIAEVMIYTPSIGRFRLVYLQDHIEMAHLASLALEAAPDQMVDKDLEETLLEHAMAYGIVLRIGDQRRLALSENMPPQVDRMIDLRDDGVITTVMHAFETLFQTENRIIRLIGISPRDENVLVEVLIDEDPMRFEMYDFSQRILALSIFISVVTTALLYFCLQWMMVRPIRRVADSMSSFRDNPENPDAIILAGERGDEIGLAERELSYMQITLRGLLSQKNRLANLGSAAAQVNHDLRNILTKAMLISDRLSMSEDTSVKKLAPELWHTVDQAIDMCSQTLNYVSGSRPVMDKSLFYLQDLILEVEDHVQDVKPDEAAFLNAVDPMAEIMGDETQLRRVLVNLCRNAFQMGATRVEVTTMSGAEDVGLCVDVMDNGPGLPAKARENLFKAFEASARKGGTGLGLVISRDIMRAHGGDLNLVETGPSGTVFKLTFPSPQDDS